MLKEINDFVWNLGQVYIIIMRGFFCFRCIFLPLRLQQCIDICFSDKAWVDLMTMGTIIKLNKFTKDETLVGLTIKGTIVV